MSLQSNPLKQSLSTNEAGAHAIVFGFDNTYLRLPERFYVRVRPSPVIAPRLIRVNEQLARLLKLDPDALATEEGVRILAGNTVAAGSEPVAFAYAGHQFGRFVPQLGDGRARLLGDLVGIDGIRYDVQLKGSGPTPFSRRGDGRATLGSVLREYIVSEAMASLGVPTTRALAAVTTGQQVFREEIYPGAVLTRVASSHLRIGTFEYFAALEDIDAIRKLAHYAIARHYPRLAEARRPVRALLETVIARHASLVARWMLIGFVHGVMNTDNMSIAGETIDYGPCAFMEAYDPAMVLSSIDHHGRYAYDKQPDAALWNLTRFAESLLPLLEEEEGSGASAIDVAADALSTFRPQFQQARAKGLRQKLGLQTEQAGDDFLAEDLLALMASDGADFTLTFRRLCEAAKGVAQDAGVSGLFRNSETYNAWAVRWRDRLRIESYSGEVHASVMQQVNPAVIPRNHFVAAAIKAAVEREDFQPFEELLMAVSSPYVSRPEMNRYEIPARPEERITQTFCGT